MASSVSWKVWGAVTLALLGGAGCDSEESRFPPPQPGTTKPAGPFGGGGGGGGDGGQGGAGGSTGTVPNVCECAYSAITKDACGECVNEAENGDCSAERTACELEGACVEVAGCPAQCTLLPSDQQVACVQACIVEKAGVAGFHVYAAFMACVCGLCAGTCATGAPIACE